MSVSMLVAVGGLFAVGTYLVTARSLTRIILGVALMGHGAVLALLTAGGRAGEPPIADGTPPTAMADPLPQALGLTAIVISFGLTVFLLALGVRQSQHTGDDLVEDDLEDRRVAAERELLESERPREAETEPSPIIEDAPEAA